jgi:hypothetical protein
VGAGERLALAMANRAETIALALAAQRLQCSLLILPAQLSQERAGARAVEAGATYLFCSDGHPAAGRETGSGPVTAIPLGSPQACLSYSDLLAATDLLPASANDADDLSGIDAARKLLAPLQIRPESGHVHYCGTPLWRDDALARALAFLHFGHPVILEGSWSPARMLHSLHQYQATTCQLDREQVELLLAAVPHLPQSQQIALDYLFPGDVDKGDALCHALQKWCGGTTHVGTSAQQATALPLRSA